MEAQELLLTAARGVAVYVFMLFVIRLLGKRSVGAFSAFDLLVALMLGEVVDEIIYGDVSMAQGFVAIGTIAACELAVEWMVYKSRRMDAILQGKPAVIIRDGAIQFDALARERMSEQDVYAQLRMQSIEDIREVKMAVLEPDGSVSVIKQEWAETVRRADLGGHPAKQKEQETHGQQCPPAEKDTISPYALQQEAA